MAPNQDEVDFFTKAMMSAGYQITGELKSIVPD